jgi:NAD(P)-dependent dehydrogenase (short-subunit alcohol dehydrogenase family)
MKAMSKKEQSKVWFITGISRGFGRELASAALEQGDVVIGTSRNGKSDIGAVPDGSTCSRWTLRTARMSFPW